MADDGGVWTSLLSQHLVTYPQKCDYIHIFPSRGYIAAPPWSGLRNHTAQLLLPSHLCLQRPLVLLEHVTRLSRYNTSVSFLRYKFAHSRTIHWRVGQISSELQPQGTPARCGGWRSPTHGASYQLVLLYDVSGMET